MQESASSSEFASSDSLGRDSKPAEKDITPNRLLLLKKKPWAVILLKAL
ncbi:MAG: hypothetical protein ACJAS1_001378 [Oleiphilaceae bacterium]|jgi:hypothetical protein